MVDTVLFKNQAISTLIAAITAIDTELTVAPGDGALFPAPDVYEYAVVTLTDTGTGNREIVHCTGRTGDVLSIDRAQEGTSALPFDAGVEVAMHITAGVLEYLRDL